MTFPRIWRRLFLPIGLLLGLLFIPAAADQPLVDRTRAEVQAVKDALVGHESDFDALLNLRARIDPLRDDLRERVTELGRRRDQMAARMTDFGGEPDDAAVPQSEAAQKDRDEFQKTFATLDAEFKQEQLTLSGADALWTQLSDLRSAAFTKRIFLQGASPLTPAFWSKLITRGIPATIRRSRRVLDQEAERVDFDGTGKTIATLVTLLVVLSGAFALLHRLIARRVAAQRAAAAETFSRRLAVRHAFLVLMTRAVPLPLMVGLFDAAIEYFDLSSDNVDLLIARGAIAVLIIGVSRGIMAALLSPRRPALRLVDCSDETATTVERAVIVSANIFVGGIVATAYEDVISAPTSIILATSTVVALGIIVVFGHALVVLRNRPAARAAPIAAPAVALDPATLEDGRLTLRLGWVRPLLVLALAVGLVALGMGYVTLAGFLMSRLVIVVLVVALAILLGLFIDEFFGKILSSRSPSGEAAAHAIGLSGGVLDLVSTTLAGLLRLVVVCLALLFAFGPWGIRFGDINPFNDALFAFSFRFVRLSLGTVSFALLTFVMGLLGTRLIVGWLDKRLLPLTTLDLGARNSMTTIMGYVGFAATVLVVLSQLGVDSQKLAVVAGALSVGIGFGLQAITSNFISGLIVLAERPIRVGDIVTVKGEEGRVKKISVRSTLIGGFDRADIIVPNTDILTSIVKNKSLSDRQFRLKFSLIVDQDSDEEAVARIMQEAATGHEHVLDEPPPQVFFTRAYEVGLEFELRCFVDDIDNVDRLRSDLHFAITGRFRREGIKLASTKASADAAPAALPQA